MKVVEAQDIINSLYKQITQKTDITAVDNTSLVDMGKTLQTGAYSREEIYNTIIDKVGQTVLRNRFNFVFTLLLVLVSTLSLHGCLFSRACFSSSCFLQSSHNEKLYKPPIGARV